MEGTWIQERYVEIFLPKYYVAAQNAYFDG